jgi:ATP-dependent exoDNAse (exonuclease V) beta subunit
LHAKNSGFALELFEPIKLSRVELEGKRLYCTESGERYPSVTTALSLIGKKKLHEWRKRVGEAHANEVSKTASTAGTAIHNIAEKYMLNDLSWQKAMPIALSRFEKIRTLLDENIKTVYGVELQMYSSELKTAGTVDLISDWGGELAIVDFKTSRRQKTKEEIQSYFLQCAAYSIMAEELYGYKAKKIVVPIAVHEDDPLLFIEPIEPWQKAARAYFRLYHSGKLF